MNGTRDRRTAVLGADLRNAAFFRSLEIDDAFGRLLLEEGRMAAMA